MRKMLRRGCDLVTLTRGEFITVGFKVRLYGLGPFFTAFIKDQSFCFNWRIRDEPDFLAFLELLLLLSAQFLRVLLSFFSFGGVTPQTNRSEAMVCFTVWANSNRRTHHDSVVGVREGAIFSRKYTALGSDSVVGTREFLVKELALVSVTAASRGHVEATNNGAFIEDLTVFVLFIVFLLRFTHFAFYREHSAGEMVGLVFFLPPIRAVRFRLRITFGTAGFLPTFSSSSASSLFHRVVT